MRKPNLTASGCSRLQNQWAPGSRRKRFSIACVSAPRGIRVRTSAMPKPKWPYRSCSVTSRRIRESLQLGRRRLKSLRGSSQRTTLAARALQRISAPRGKWPALSDRYVELCLKDVAGPAACRPSQASDSHQPCGGDRFRQDRWWLVRRRSKGLAARRLPDRQTLELIERVQALSGLSHRPRKILDTGAGVGGCSRKNSGVCRG